MTAEFDAIFNQHLVSARDWALHESDQRKHASDMRWYNYLEF